VSLHDRITEEVRALAGLDLEGLRAEWRRRYGLAPKLRSPALLAHMLAWRIQTDALGGLQPDLARRLRRGVGLAKPRTQLPIGARLSREWLGQAHLVEVVAAGFLYDKKTYRSLSAVAGAITGGKWNGRRFFGLDKDASA